MQGIEFKAVAYITPPAIETLIPKKEKNNGYIATGIYADIFSVLSKTLNFTYSVNMAKYGSSGKPGVNGTWTGIIGDLQRGKYNISNSTKNHTSITLS